jgi:hypothetical protein
MASHSRVNHCTRIAVADEYIYKIERTDGLKPVRVFLSDAYRYGYADYLGRPAQIKRGDFILIAKPEAAFDVDLSERIRQDGIGIGKIGRLMGSLNVANICDYVSPEEREQNSH